MLTTMARDWTHLFENHRGKWVALAEDEVTVLAAAPSARQAHEAAGTGLHFLYRVPDTLDAFVGHEV